jgi:hypothetical protein
MRGWLSSAIRIARSNVSREPAGGVAGLARPAGSVSPNDNLGIKTTIKQKDRITVRIHIPHSDGRVWRRD